MKPETALKKVYADELKKHGRVTRIENIVESGTPDFNVCVGGLEAWIEFKAPSAPSKTTSKVFGRASHKVTPEQANFIEKQTLCGGIAIIVIKCGKWMFTVPGQYVRNVNDATIDWLADVSLHRVDIDPKRAAQILVPALFSHYRGVKK